MKTALPKEVLALAAKIRDRRHAIEQHRADIERMKTKAEEADQLNAEMEALRQKRAEHKAVALVAGKPADLKELDAKQDALEHASRQAREDGVAATLAITMLETKISDIEAEIEKLAEQRKAKTIEWLAAQREKAVDRWLEALGALGPIVADALAFEAARRSVVGGFFRIDDVFKTAKAGVFGLPNPRGRWEKRDGLNNDRWIRASIGWDADQEHGKPERDALFAALKEAEVLP